MQSLSTLLMTCCLTMGSGLLLLGIICPGPSRQLLHVVIIIRQISFDSSSKRKLDSISSNLSLHAYNSKFGMLAKKYLLYKIKLYVLFPKCLIDLFMFRKSIVVLNLMLAEKRSIFNDVQISLVNTNYAKKKKELNLRADKIWRRFFGVCSNIPLSNIADLI